MGLGELFIIAVGLSMDAFAVSVCKGLSAGRARPQQMLCAGLYFGGFQALMPLAGFWLGTRFRGLISSFDSLIAFALLALIGLDMLWQAKKGGQHTDARFGLRSMLPLAVATSIDALAVGISLACLEVSIVPAVCLIGAVTFLFSAAGVGLGSVFGKKYRGPAQALGGLILIAMALKILLEHLGVLGP